MKLRHVLAVVAIELCSGAARAETAKPLDSEANWAKKPSEEDIIAVWPKAAMASGRGGKATIHCKVSRQGVLYDCSVASESPAGAGFGQAGIALSRQFLMRPAMRNGEPVEGAGVFIPLNFPSFTRPMDMPIETATVVSIGRWTQAPTYAEVAAAYPAKARAQGVAGHVALNCTLAGDGHLRSCEKISTQPEGMGFDSAAKQLASRFVAPLTLDGKTTKGMITQVAFAFAPAMLSGAEPEIGKPHWTALPTGEQMLSAFPGNRGSTGPSTVRVRLSCLIVTGGKMEDCRVVSEDPAGEGFGAAAVAVSKYFEVSIWSGEGLPTVGGRVWIPIRYELGAPPASAAKPQG